MDAGDSSRLRFERGGPSVRTLKKEYLLHIMLLPGVIVTLIYAYGPMAGLVMAFQQFEPLSGFFHSKFVGFDNFKYVFNMPDFKQVLWNTVLIAVIKMVLFLLVPLILALLLNEVTKRWFSRFIQSAVFLPFFLSWTVLGGVIIELFSLSGPVKLSSNTAAMAGEVKLWPVGFNFDAYRYLGEKVEFFRSLGVSVERVVLGTAVNMFLCFVTAYPLSKSVDQFKFRTVYVWFFAITMFFGGGLIPTYIIVKNTGLIDSIWALILPGALNVWNMVLMLNFFRTIPRELDEAATIDGAGHWRILWRIYLPVSLPSIATIGLFTIVGHWNSWFDGILYLNSPEKYPLQTYLSTLIMSINSQMTSVSIEQIKAMENLSEKTLQTAQIFMGALPIMVVYPFLQKYFVKGMTVGSVKE